MIIIDSIKQTKQVVACYKAAGKSIGFVPTMGALHNGHLSLVEQAGKNNDIVAVSIFVNPLQFNNKEDLEKYPRNVNEDIEKLKKKGVDIVFMPSVEEMYPEKVEKSYDFGSLERVMEGAFRPGHFNGVAIVVERLFNIIQPDNAYFGEKDFQQLAIIKRLVEIEQMDLKIIGCPIIREESGLAMSSRNERLTKQERAEATIIFRTLSEAAQMKKTHSLGEVEAYVKKCFDESSLRLEYFSLVDADTLLPIKAWTDSKNIRGFIAAFSGHVRLIDNIAF
ncbi:MAG: pantoate--beta-alanine ligase [Bacteroidetes bacterium]|nr:MAG: pantoate--beta-alanine ligase [Bacteroidota bacterium]